MTRYIRHYVEEMMAQPVITADASVRQLVFALLPSGRCTSNVVAQRLGVDRKTVHRRLAARGETFSSILNEVRDFLQCRVIIRFGATRPTNRPPVVGNVPADIWGTLRRPAPRHLSK